MERHFRRLAALLCCGYLAIEACYILRLPLVMDEFDHASHIYRLTQGIPYQAYAPAKTVLGFYLLLPALLAFRETWAAMLAVKLEIACLTALTLLFAALRLRRHFAAPAILGALLLLCTQSTFLERSCELRVDMLAALCGLISLLALLDRRSWLAGAAAGCAVLMTQKGAYFVLALGGGLLLQAAYLRSRQLLLEALAAGCSACLVVLGYVAFWCVAGQPSQVWQGMLLGPRSVAFENLYSIEGYWWQTLRRNPIFYALGLWGLVRLTPRSLAREDAVHGRLWTYGLCLLALCVWHKQPWPYFFVLLIPTVWVLVAALLSQAAAWGSRWRTALQIAVVGGSCVSMLTRAPVVLQRSATEQRGVVAAITAFLQPGETYLAGTELAWRRPHVASLRWLDRLALREARRASQSILEELRAAPPRLLIDNDRIRHLPPMVQEEFARSFAAVGGNLRTYAPRLESGASPCNVAYGGNYRVSAPGESRVRLDSGPWWRDGDRVEVTAGIHFSEVIGSARLISWSDAPAFRAQTDRPTSNLFDRVYDY